MRSIIILLPLLLTGLLACNSETQAPSEPAAKISPMAYQPVLQLDQAHNALRQDSAMPYLMRPHSTLFIDPADYAIRVPADLNRPEIQAKFGDPGPVTGPNVVHVLCQNDVFVGKWEMEDGKIRLDASTLSKGQNGKTFSSFQDRDNIYLMIGFQGNRAPGEKNAAFAPFYAARVLVDKNPLRFVHPRTEPQAL